MAERPPESRDELLPPAAEKGATPRHATLLFVEDEPSLASLGARQLESLGYRVVAHLSSLDALEDFRMRAEEFDAVITDNTMPHMSGLELCRELKRIRPGLPVLMLSGLAHAVGIEVLRKEGIRAVLAKPYRRDELAAAVEGLLATHEEAAP